MVTMLNSYLLPEDIVTKMKERIEETKKARVELGFGLCRLKSNIVRSGEECTGEKCMILVREICPQAGLYVGGFHTHPTASAKPSIADLLHAYRNDVECIGSVKEDKIQCYIRVEPKNPQTEEKFREAKIIEDREKTSREDYQEYIRIRDELLGKHFKEIEIR